MLYYEIYSYISDSIIANMLTKEEADHFAGPFGENAVVREMIAGDVEMILGTEDLGIECDNHS